VLEIGKQKTVGVKLPVLIGRSFERHDFGFSEQAPSVQLIARDAFVADVSIKIDQLCAEIRSVSRELEIAKGDIAALRDESERNFRFVAFQDADRRTTASRHEALSKRLEDVKRQVEHIRGHMSGERESYNSFEAVSKKLCELSEFERQFRTEILRARLSAYLFCGSVLMWLFAVLAT
jgi:chromosome segregation ATPase